MKIFLFYVNGICGLEDWLDRELLFQVKEYKEDEEKLYLIVNLEDTESLRKLRPGRNYAIQLEYTGTKELKYYYLKAYEIAENQSSEYDIILHISPLEV